MYYCNGIRILLSPLYYIPRVLQEASIRILADIITAKRTEIRHKILYQFGLKEPYVQYWTLAG